MLDLLVKGGLAGGRVLLFGDFERQAIFESGDGRALLASACHDLAVYRLTANCRNLPRIGYVVQRLSHLEPGYRRFRRAGRRRRPDFIPYTAGRRSVAHSSPRPCGRSATRATT